MWENYLSLLHHSNLERNERNFLSGLVSNSVDLHNPAIILMPNIAVCSKDALLLPISLPMQAVQGRLPFLAFQH